jgi:ketosteroid isomerase-like protein
MATSGDEDAIREVVDRETRAWDSQDVELLLSVFHPDMVWPWPPSADAHDPVDWEWGMGRFDARRWRGIWGELFATHELVHNRRRTVRIDVSPEGDGGLAVVDVDTLWRRRDGGGDFHWKGRAGKVYSRVGEGWKLTMHTGLLRYGD